MHTQKAPTIIFLIAILITACGANNTDQPKPPSDLPAFTPTSPTIEDEQTTPVVDNTDQPQLPTDPPAFAITSPAFEDGQPISAVYTCDGEDFSPELNWEGAPEETQSFALIMDDPDAPAGTWVHWVIYNIPANTTQLAENIPPEEALINQAVHGNNSWKKIGYGGPCPPSGTHRYFFTLYALDIQLQTDASINKSELLELIEGRILTQTTLMGTYTRK